MNNDVQSWLYGKPMTVEQVEQENMSEDDGRVPHVPFGFINDEWEQLKAQMQPGDEFRKYSSSEESWELLYGRGGIALVRLGFVVNYIETVVT